jgi:hypothetical protein
MHDIKTPVDAPRFTLIVDGVKMRVTRLGFHESGDPVFELADTGGDTRDILPRDVGRVGADGGVYARIGPLSDNDHGVSWQYVGEVEQCLHRVGDSVAAELADAPPSERFDDTEDSDE